MDRQEADKQANTVPPIAAQALEGRSEADVVRLGKKAQKLLEQNPRISKAFFSMIVSVRLYNTAIAAINDECLQAKLGDDSAAIVYILINSVRKITSKEFERGELSQHIQQHVLEFIAMELSLERERESHIAKESSDSQESIRRRRNITLDYALRQAKADESPCDIGRERTVLLVGKRELLQQITDVECAAKEYKQTTVRLLDTMKQHTDVSRKGNTNQWYYELGVNRWASFAVTRRRATELLYRMCHRLRGNRLDLLVVDDLSSAGDTSGQPIHLRAGAAQKIIRQYADEAGAAVLCCLPTYNADPADKIWDKLEVYTDLRFVGTDANDEITIATRGGDSWFAIPEAKKDLSDGGRDTDKQHSGGLP